MTLIRKWPKHLLLASFFNELEITYTKPVFSTSLLQDLEEESKSLNFAQGTNWELSVIEIASMHVPSTKQNKKDFMAWS